MSLKYFHILFILLAVMTTIGFGLWAILVNGLPGGLRAMGGFSVASGVVLLVYGIRFLRKARSIII